VFLWYSEHIYLDLTVVEDINQPVTVYLKVVLVHMDNRTIRMHPWLTWGCWLWKLLGHADSEFHVRKYGYPSNKKLCGLHFLHSSTAWKIMWSMLDHVFQLWIVHALFNWTLCPFHWRDPLLGHIHRKHHW
jgi:hypothetical protein